MNCKCENSQTRIEIISGHYLPNFGKNLENHQILDWESRDAQNSRFSVLTENVSLNGRTLLDVGCGLADLYSFLLDNGIKPDYTGIDILPEMAKSAISRYPEVKILCGDIFSEPELIGKNKYEVVFSSGIFNLNLGNNIEFLDDALKLFHEISSEYIVFNLLSEKSDNREDKYYYYSIKDVETAVKKICFSKVKIVEDYLLNDLSVICVK